MLTRLARLRRDRRGAAAFETPIIMIFVVVALLFPIADVGIASIQYISAFQAMRNLGTYVQYHVPPDVTSVGSWSSSLPTISGYTIAVQVMCGDTATVCSSTNTASPKYYSLSTSLTLTPIVVPFPTTPITLSYSERFQ